MQTALSMYLGGILVEVANIDSYDDCKQLGLLCPFCHEPVFYRAASVERLFGKSTIKSAKACFSHYYHSEDTINCEVRSISTGSKELLEQVAIAGRNQRLSLYNLYLWEMFTIPNKITPKGIGYLRNDVGKKRFENCLNTITLNWLSSIDEVKQGMLKVVEDITVNNVLQNTSKELKPIALTMLGYFKLNSFNKHLHIAICNEIANYLCTITGKIVLRKVISYVLAVEFVIAESRKEICKISSNDLVKTITAIIATNHWITIINEKIGNLK